LNAEMLGQCGPSIRKREIYSGTKQRQTNCRLQSSFR
jgi:hypothetical protein